MTPNKPQRKATRPSTSLGLLGIWTIVLIGGVSCYRSLQGVPERITNIPGAVPQTTPTTPSAATPTKGSVMLFDPLSPPIRFSHKLHAQEAECSGCHATASEGVKAGTPKLSDCLDCHEGTQSTAPADQAEEKKLEIYAASKKEIPWPRVGAIPSYTKFSHKVHIVEGELGCEECHGEMAKTDALPDKPPVPYNHEMCGECHEVVKQEGQCRNCHPK